MIPQITEHFGSDAQYATLHQATVSFTEMGDRTITTQVRIDGDHVPTFDDWWVEFKGEKFILPIKKPQAAKDNTTRNSLVDLTFYSWATYELKRYFFFSLAPVTAGVAIPDKYKASLRLPVAQFVENFNGVLNYYFGNTIQMVLYSEETYSTEPVAIEIDNSYLWDVLEKFYETFNLRWRIEYDSTTQQYLIKVNYPAPAITDHDFEYGYSGGLLKFERQVQDDNINNILLGRGGEKNLPYRYFKRTDPQNPSWPADPDALYELRDIYFDRLRDATFRWYVRGWMQNAHRDTTWETATEPYVYPQYTESDIPGTTGEPLHDNCLFAFRKGKTDDAFNPVEYVKDDESIELYGERWGAVDDNDDYYPTIQGKERDGLGRIDEVVDVSEILTDDIEAASQQAVEGAEIEGAKQSDWISLTNPAATAFNLKGKTTFIVPEGKHANLTKVGEWLCYLAKIKFKWSGTDVVDTIYTDDQREALRAIISASSARSYIKVYDFETKQEVSVAAIPAGEYYYTVHIELDVDTDAGRALISGTMFNDVQVLATYGTDAMNLTIKEDDENAWKPTFDIWVKNIWGTTKGAGETVDHYAQRVWGPILGDHLGKEAVVCFSTGFMAISEDYKFQIASYPVYDTSKTINGVPSEWKITLRKSDAEFDVTGLYIPNSQTNGKPVAGDKFFFAGIDMPNQYVVWAEEDLDVFKTEQLAPLSDIQPTWVITLDKVRVHTIEQADNNMRLADRLASGGLVKIRDARFSGGNVLTLYVQSLTYTWNEPSEDNPYLVPDIEVVLSDKVISTESFAEKVERNIVTIRSTFAKASEIESIVRQVATPLFLKKTGESDVSASPTTFASRVASKNFRQGDIAGAGWAHYEDEEGESVLELDKLVVRHEMRVNSLVANQISYNGGKQIISAASIECTAVEETDDTYVCYFDQKQGTVKNLFQVGDVAMGQVFDETNAELRFYKMKVTAVGADSITLSKDYRSGDSAPQKGDTIIQYGSYTDTARQYVIVRDVIGGGYEQMLSGLNSVDANGTEYYFAGRQSGSGPRWFVGAAAGDYATFQNGALTVRGNLIIKGSDGSYQAMTDYMSAVQAQIDGQITSWSSSQATTAQTAPYPQYDETTGQITGTPNFPASGWSTAAEKERHFGDIYVDDSTGQGYRYTKRLIGSSTEYYWTRITDEQLAALQETVENMGYLTSALLNGTTIVQGGLVLSSLIQLGQTENGVFKVYSGINGDLDETLTDPTTSIAAWYGGPMVDHDASPSAVEYAKALFRHDGSGYLASGRINWTPTGAGGIPGITWTADNHVIISGDVQLASLGGDSVTELITLVQKLNNMFIDETYTEGGQTKHRVKVNANIYEGFYTDGFISAGGLGSGGGGGGSVDLGRVWASLTNATPDAYASTQIALAHIPNITTSKVSNIETWIASKNYATVSQLITTARGLSDADDLLFKDPDDEGEEITIDDPGTTGTVLWGAESGYKVALSVNGMSKVLLKESALDGVTSSIGILAGYFSNGSAFNALNLEGHPANYFATGAEADALDARVTALENAAFDSATMWALLGASTAEQINVSHIPDIAISKVTGLQSALDAKQDTISDLSAIRSNASLGATAYGWGDHAQAGYLTGITSTMVTTALGYTPFDSASFTQSNIKTTLGISDWALASTKPTYTKSEVGLGNVTNDAQVKRTEMGAASGVATLGTDGKVPSSQLPSYVDDVLEYASLSVFPETGESGKIYVALDTNKTYRWSGSAYVEISPSIVIGTTTGTALDGKIGTDHISDRSNPHQVTKAQVGLSDVDNLAASGYFTLLENSSNQISLTIGGTNKTLTVAYASNAGTLETHAASYFATASGLSGLTDRVSTLEGRTNWDTYFGVDSNGDVYVKKIDENTPRNFYSYGAVTAGGVGTGGGGGGVDIDRVWESLTNNTDKPNVKINIAHIPDITTAKVTDIESWIAAKGYVTSSGITSVSKGTAVSGGAVSTSGGAVTIQFPTIPTTLPASDVYAWAKNETLQASDVPSLTVSKISDIETWISGKGYLTGNQTITLSGDVSGSGATSIAVTIGNGKVTNAKLANSSITIAGTSVSLGGAITAANLRSLLSINNVENTALSTWAGSTNITTLGTIATGVWNGTAIAANKLAIDFNWTLIGDSATYDSEDYIHVNS